jgi:hypothetical protein
MRTAQTIFPHQRAPVPGVGRPVSTARPDTRRGWRQWLRQWRVGYPLAGQRCAVPQRLYGLWDAQHEQMQTQTTEGHLDYVTRTRPALRLEIYASLASS